MRSKPRIGVLVCAMTLLAGCGAMSTVEDGKLRVVSDTTVTGFVFPESVGCDPVDKVLYVSNFGGTELKPAEKDGKGFISKVSLDGKVLESRFLPIPGDTLNKPKGIWIEGNRMWVTDLDSVWIYDLHTRRSRKLELPGVTFANDPAVSRGALYVSDNRSDKLVRVDPADFLASNVQPKVSVVFSGKSVNPNGLYPAKDGSLIMVGIMTPEQPRAIYSMSRDGDVKAISQPIGRLDGVYEARDGTLLVTDWVSGSLLRWSPKGGIEPLATGFKGPADFCVLPQADGLTVYVPDLVKSEIRIIRLGP
jgi:hypothetical protein